MKVDPLVDRGREKKGESTPLVVCGRERENLREREIPPLAPQDGMLCNAQAPGPVGESTQEMTPQDFKATMRQQLPLFLQVLQRATVGPTRSGPAIQPGPVLSASALQCPALIPPVPVVQGRSLTLLM